MDAALKKELQKVFYDPTTGYTKNAKYLRSKLPQEWQNQITLKQIKDFVNSQTNNQVSQQRRQSRSEYGIISAIRPLDELQGDLIDFGDLGKGAAVKGKHKGMSTNKGYRYLLNVIDVYSRVMVVRELKTKEADEVAVALRDVFNTLVSLVPPEKEKKGKIHVFATDNGNEFLNRQAQAVYEEFGITHRVNEPGDHNAMGIVERANQTIRRTIKKVWLFRGGRVWVDVVGPIVNAYNQREHSGIDAVPLNILTGGTGVYPCVNRDRKQCRMKKIGKDANGRAKYEKNVFVVRNGKVVETTKKRHETGITLPPRLKNLRMGDLVRVFRRRLVDRINFEKASDTPTYSRKVYRVENANTGKYGPGQRLKIRLVFDEEGQPVVDGQVLFKRRDELLKIKQQDGAAAEAYAKELYGNRPVVPVDEEAKKKQRAGRLKKRLQNLSVPNSEINQKLLLAGLGDYLI